MNVLRRWWQRLLCLFDRHGGWVADLGTEFTSIDGVRYVEPQIEGWHCSACGAPLRFEHRDPRDGWGL